MATKADFTTDEWKLILGSPMLAGMAVTLAEPSGLWGMMQEGMVSGRALLEAKKSAFPEAARAETAKKAGCTLMTFGFNKDSTISKMCHKSFILNKIESKQFMKNCN
jgi:hypothetical protein